MKKQVPLALQITLLVLCASLLGISLVFTFKNVGLVAEGNLLQAEKNVQQVATPLNYEERLRKGNQLMDKGFYELAANEYAFAINLQEENPSAHYMLGQAYLALHKPDKAAEQFDRARALAPSELAYDVAYGQALIENEQFEEAQALFDGFTKEMQEAKYYGAVLDSTYDRFEDAEEKFQRAAELKGSILENNIQIYLDVFADFQEQQDAQEIYLKTRLAKAMVDTKLYSLAEFTALDVLESKSDYRDAWILLGYAKLKRQDLQEAEDAFNQAKKLDAIKPETHYFLGLTHFEQGEHEECIQSMELALLYNFEPQVEAYRKIAESQLALERYNEALEAYEYLVKIDASKIELFTTPVWIAISKIHDLDRALSLSEDAVSNFPFSAQSHNLLAWTYMEREQLDEAEKAIQKSFDLNPNLAESHLTAGKLRQAQGNLEGAKWEYKKAYELAESDSDVSQEAAEAYNTLILSPAE